MSDVETSAREFAVKAHGAQRYGDEPYVVHLEAVRDVLIEFGCHDSVLLIAAWLHDVIEDTSITRGMIDLSFGMTVGNYVWAVTGVGKNRAERTRSIREKLHREPQAILVKLADRIANMRSAKESKPDLFAMYAREHHEFESVLRPVTRRAAVVGAEAMWNELDRIVRSSAIET